MIAIGTDDRPGADIIIHIDGVFSANQFYASGGDVGFNHLPSGTVSITGVATQGQTLVATDTLADLDGLGAVGYQWRAGGEDIAGATGSTHTLTAAQAGMAVTVIASYIDGHGTHESLSSAALQVSAVTGKAASVLAYSWNAHTLLEAVGVSSINQSGITDATGRTSFVALTDASLALTVNRLVPAVDSEATSGAVNLQDAIAILKMIVGLDVNGANKPLSPYQALAADFDGNGSVGLSDAIGVLKHVVGLSAPEPKWWFLNEADSTVPAKANVNPGTPQGSVTVGLGGAGPVHVGLVAYLSGDVDGSYVGGGTQTLAPAYFQSLHASAGLDLAQFGIYGP